jgi:DNA-binding LacI/PurR family transcriptional regulator
MHEKRSITIKELAERAGVSVATVSAALGGNYRTIHVSEATKERIRLLAEQLDYRPNATARSLRRNATDILGFLGSIAPRQAFYSELLIGLKEGCEQHRKDLLLHSEYRKQTPDEIYAELANGRIDGLILHTPKEPSLARRLGRSRLPTVAVVDAMPELPSVVADDAGGIRMLVEYLKQRGHRRILIKVDGEAVASQIRRHRAFLQATAEYGVQGETWTAHDFEMRTEETAAALRLDRPANERPTAVLCWHDVSADALIAQCLKMGLRIPDDIAICGFDGLPAPVGVSWKLTTIHAPWEEVTRQAVTLLVQRIEGQEIPVETLLPVTLVAGDTA